ncbi:MAG: glycosyltransferase family 2 protein, partial [Gemmatimonadales bacterium]|nr:glycosyltransferase family 2 protein [Gemmatimonadales bacterium]
MADGGGQPAPRVSVITIFLNGERFIQEAIDSILAQTYDDWELLLVDDGSTDASTSIALRYAEQHPGRIGYLQHPGHRNHGMSTSRNLGVKHARGEYVAFLDADDVWLPQKLERQTAILESEPAAAMVYGATQHWHSWTGRAEDLHRDRNRRLGVPPNTLVPPPTLVRLFLGREAWTPATCGVLIRRAAIDQAGGFEDRFRGMFEDQAFFYKLCLIAPVFVEAGCWDRYRQHPDSWCEVARKRGEYEPGYQPNPARGTFLNWLADYLAAQKVDEPELWKLLRREL